MIREAFDRDVPPANTDDAFDNTNIALFFIENSALFDVQLEESHDFARLTPGQIETIRITTERENALSDGHAAVAYNAQGIVANLADHGPAAREATFFIGKNDNFEGVARTDASGLQQLDDFDRADDAHVAVVVAAAGHGVDVRAKQYGRQIRFAALAAPDDVAGPKTWARRISPK